MSGGPIDPNQRASSSTPHVQRAETRGETRVGHVVKSIGSSVKEVWGKAKGKWDQLGEKERNYLIVAAFITLIAISVVCPPIGIASAVIYGSKRAKQKEELAQKPLEMPAHLVPADQITWRTIDKEMEKIHTSLEQTTTTKLFNEVIEGKSTPRVDDLVTKIIDARWNALVEHRKELLSVVKEEEKERFSKKIDEKFPHIKIIEEAKKEAEEGRHSK